MASEEEDRLFALWDGWLDRIHEDIQNVLVIRFVFEGVVKIIRANPELEKPSHFYSWLEAVCSTAALLGIRRQVDVDSRSVAFVRLLSELADRPSVLSRERHVAHYEKASQPAWIAHREFDRLAGSGSPHIRPDQIQRDIGQLRRAAASAKAYADRAVAHLDARGPDAIPTAREVDECPRPP